MKEYIIYENENAIASVKADSFENAVEKLNKMILRKKEKAIQAGDMIRGWLCKDGEPIDDRSIEQVCMYGEYSIEKSEVNGLTYIIQGGNEYEVQDKYSDKLSEWVAV